MGPAESNLIKIEIIIKNGKNNKIKNIEKKKSKILLKGFIFLKF